MDWLLNAASPALELAGELARGDLGDRASPLRGRAEAALVALRVDAEGAARGYSERDLEDVRLALAALLDELALRQRGGARERWQADELLAQRFVHATLTTGGDRFFEALDARLAAPRTRSCLAVLRIFALCLELGFTGRHAAADDPAALDRLRRRLRTRLGRLAEAPGGSPRPALHLRPPAGGGALVSALAALAALMIVAALVAGLIAEARLRRAVEAARVHIDDHRRALVGGGER